MKKSKKITIALISFLVVIISLITILLIINSTTYKLKKIGYQEDEISVLEEKTTKEDKDTILELPYLPYLYELLNHEGYNSTKLLDYINYVDKTTIDYKMDDIIYIVNNNINYEYSTKLSDLISAGYFVLENLDRYMNYTEKENIDEIIKYVNSNRDSEYYTNIEDTDVLKNELLIVNKYYKLADDYVPDELVVMDKNYDNKTNSKLNKVAYEAFKKLSDDARSEGYYIYNNSAYRSYNSQLSIYNSYKNSYGFKYAENIAARPGHSEHQTGLALDVGVRKDKAVGLFENSKEFTWMKENSYKYGFILRYPKGKEDITGYRYEAWHYRYVGVDVATYIYENDITFEEYYAYFVENK